MKKQLAVFCLIMSLLFCAKAYADFDEAMTLPFGLDGRDWNIGWSNPSGQMTEFVVKGQTVENWKELVTLQFYPGLQTRSASDFMNNFIAQMQKAEPLAKATSTSGTADDAYLEWNVLGSKKNTDQFELDRFVRGKQGIYVVHYAIKTSSFPEDQRAKWFNFLRNAKLRQAQGK